jgi:phosphoribosyl 1,2-cyclic phosphodiesterase
MNEGTMRAVEKTGLDMRLVRLFRTNEDFYIKNLCINAVPTSHDAAESVGYTIECGERRFSFFTDLGYVSKEILELAKESALVVLEANHDVEMLQQGKYPQTLKKRILGRKGHLSNATCAETVVELANHGVAQVILAHISGENNDPELARATVINHLYDQGIREGKDILVGLALQNIISPIYEVE